MTAPAPPPPGAPLPDSAAPEEAWTLALQLLERLERAGQDLREAAAPLLGEAGTLLANGAERAQTALVTLWARLGEAGLQAPAAGLAAAALAAALLAPRLRRAGPAGAGGAPLAAYVRGPRRMGWAAILVFFGLGGGLAAAIPLASAALAPGVISPDGSRKAVQHLEGGIVRAIHVREGDVVEAGQPLLTLEGTQARADLGELHERLLYLTAIEARLAAEQVQAARILRPETIGALGSPAAVAAVLQGQQDLFESRRATQAGRERILDQRVLQLREESNGLREVIGAQDVQLRLIQQEIDSVTILLQKGLERVPRLLALQRQQAELRGERANNKSRIARNEQAIGQTEMELLTTRQQMREKVNEELGTVRTELATLRSKLPARTDVLARTSVAAPIGGTVMNVRVTTETGVVKPGEMLLEIVPREAKLIIDARIRPSDIDVVRAGLRTKVVFSAFAQRNLPQFHGTLRSVSADRMTDERTGEHYFLAKVEVDADDLKALRPDQVLSAGMPADVYVLTGERTTLDYLVRPFVDSLGKSFREI